MTLAQFTSGFQAFAEARKNGYADRQAQTRAAAEQQLNTKMSRLAQFIGASRPSFSLAKRLGYNPGNREAGVRAIEQSLRTLLGGSASTLAAAANGRYKTALSIELQAVLKANGLPNSAVRVSGSYYGRDPIVSVSPQYEAQVKKACHDYLLDQLSLGDTTLLQVLRPAEADGSGTPAANQAFSDFYAAFAQFAVEYGIGVTPIGHLSDNVAFQVDPSDGNTLFVVGQTHGTEDAATYLQRLFPRGTPADITVVQNRDRAGSTAYPLVFTARVSYNP